MSRPSASPGPSPQGEGEGESEDEGEDESQGEGERENDGETPSGRSGGNATVDAVDDGVAATDSAARGGNA